MVASLLFVFSSFIALAAANPLSGRAMQVHESRASVPASFTKTGTPSPDTILTFRVALAQTDPDGLTDALYDVSTPSSANYGNHLTKEEVRLSRVSFLLIRVYLMRLPKVEKFVTPKPETIAAVNQWFSENGITTKQASPAGDWLTFNTTVSKISEMLDADFSIFTHTASGDQSVRTLAYSIPSNLKDHVLLVHPTISSVLIHIEGFVVADCF